jgi:hypothetical protein
MSSEKYNTNYICLKCNVDNIDTVHVRLSEYGGQIIGTLDLISYININTLPNNYVIITDSSELRRIFTTQS